MVATMITRLKYNPDFLKLWAGQSVSEVGSRISRTALPLAAVLVLQASEFQMGVLSGVAAAGVLAFGLMAGALADRLRRRPIMIAADLTRAALLATIPAAFALGSLTMGHLYLVAAATGVMTVLFDVTLQAYIPYLAEREHLLEANSKLSLSGATAEVVGPGVAGILVQWITAPMAILFDAASFVCSAISLGLIRKPEQQRERQFETHIWYEIVEGLRTVRNDSRLQALARRTATAAFFIGFPSSLYFLFALRILSLDAGTVGIIISVGGVTSFLGAATSERLVSRFGIGRTLLGSATVIGLSSLLVPLAHGSRALCCVFLAASQMCDVAWPVYTINETSLRQAITPDRLLGRVNSAMHLLFWGVLPVGALAGGVLAKAVGIRRALFLGSAGVLLSTLWLVFSPLRRLQELPRSSSEKEAPAC